KGELAENEFRKDFTPSERVAIGEAIERELQGRNGVRHDTSAARENFPEVAGRSRDLAAKAAGFGNGKTYEQAKNYCLAWCAPSSRAIWLLNSEGPPVLHAWKSGYVPANPGRFSDLKSENPASTLIGGKGVSETEIPDAAKHPMKGRHSGFCEINLMQPCVKPWAPQDHGKTDLRKPTP
ncbi:hypothetical protein, partial [Azorhizophilus paspali]